MVTIDMGDFAGQIDRSLEKLRTFGLAESYVDIYVPRNSVAGKYAGIIHDGKGSSWFKRGAGTVAKGKKADDKFITRAISDDKRKIARLIIASIRDAMAGRNTLRRNLKLIGVMVQRDARENAPRSPSKSQYKRTLKTSRGRKKSKATLSPGGLQNSIKWRIG